MCREKWGTFILMVPGKLEKFYSQKLAGTNDFIVFVIICIKNETNAIQN